MFNEFINMIWSLAMFWWIVIVASCLMVFTLICVGVVVITPFLIIYLIGCKMRAHNKIINWLLNYIEIIFEGA